jgi:hypothetical protein
VGHRSVGRRSSVAPGLEVGTEARVRRELVDFLSRWDGGEVGDWVARACSRGKPLGVVPYSASARAEAHGLRMVELEIVGAKARSSS